ncbi:hypothetical protein HYU22_05245 [Candidatus Woesearchaeota archaeon]|nr:hypothetical protein [Candidatus Woesearchaeota archaeon]
MLSKLELKRQLLHILVGLVTVLLLYLDILSAFSIFLLILIGFLLSFLVKRKIRLPVLDWFLRNFERPEQLDTLPGKGTLFFFIGSLLVLKLFDKDIALASIMVLTFGDSVSHIFGAKFGRLQNFFNGKSRKLYEGTLMGFLAGFGGAVLFVSFPLAFVGSFTAMVAEVIKIDFNDKTLDDNIVVPLVAGTVMFLMRTFL